MTGAFFPLFIVFFFINLIIQLATGSLNLDELLGMTTTM